MDRNEIYKAIERERDYQDNKYGAVHDRPHSVVEWLLIMRKELEEAENGWIHGTEESALEELLQVVAVGVAAMEQHGFVERIELEGKN